MRAFGSYVSQLENLLDGVLTTVRRTGHASQVAPALNAALDGQPSRILRKVVPSHELRRAGAYFTGAKLARRLARLVGDSLDDNAIVLDPACGAGDLLIAVAGCLPLRPTLALTLRKWGRQLIGSDLYSEFIKATKLRLVLAALRRRVTPADWSWEERAIDSFPLIKAGSGLTDLRAFASATHVVLNPPFLSVDAPAACAWGHGKVNAAALFVETCVNHARAGTRILAILPDVLRSGARYQKWREIIGSRARFRRTVLCGQFQPWADVHVFLAELEVTPKRKATVVPVSVLQAVQGNRTEQVRNRFVVTVGPVVDYRDPKRGMLTAYIRPRDLPPWGQVRRINSRRKYRGRLQNGPFVVVRRTSRPGDSHRAVGTLIVGQRPVAVENHLLILIPKDGTISACRRLLSSLRDKRTSTWLDRRIRCRHLTVASLATTPLWERSR